MRIALKYGLLITLGVIAWVVVAHLLVPDPRSQIHNLGAGVFFNLLEIAGIYLAIKTARNETGNQLSFKDGVKTGMATALVYALTSCLFFLVAILTVGLCALYRHFFVTRSSTYTRWSSQGRSVLQAPSVQSILKSTQPHLRPYGTWWRRA